MGVWVFVTVGRKDVEYQSDKDNLRVTDFIFQSFLNLQIFVSLYRVIMLASVCQSVFKPHKEQNVW